MANPSDYWSRRSDRIDEILESARVAAAFASAALKSAILLNGAAALAILAFVANQWSAVAAGEEAVKDAAVLVPPLRHFVVGVFSAVLATGVGYFSAYAENRGLWYWVEDKKKVYKTMFALTSVFQIAAVVFVVYAYVRFWLGMEAGIAALVG